MGNERAPTLTDAPAFRYCRDPYGYRRRPTRVVRIGNVGVGGGNPIRVQSMTTADTSDPGAVVREIIRLVKAGCEIVRLAVPTVREARCLPVIREGLLKEGVDIPLVADIHYSPAAALEAADHVEKIRINPGNFAYSKRPGSRACTAREYARELVRVEERFTPLVKKLKALKRALRIGVNHGSLSGRILDRYGDTPQGMVESALEYVRLCEGVGFRDIVLSIKASDPRVMIAANRLLAARLDAEGMDYPLHLGVTESGSGTEGRVRSAVGIGSLLEDGLGDTIRVSLTEDPACEMPAAFSLAGLFRKRRGMRRGRAADSLTPWVPCDKTHGADSLTPWVPCDKTHGADWPGFAGPKTRPAGACASGASAPITPWVPRPGGRGTDSITPWVPRPGGRGTPERRYVLDPFGYSRRRTEAVRMGPLSLGASHPVRVVLALGNGPGTARPETVEGLISRRTGHPLEILAWPICSARDLEALRVFRGSFSKGKERPAILGRFETPALVREGLTSVDMAGLRLPSGTRAAPLFKGLLCGLREAGVPLYLEGRVPEEVARFEAMARKCRVGVVAALDGPEPGRLLRGYRRLAAELARTGSRAPIHLKAPASDGPLEQVLLPSILIGSLLCDGIGDAVQVCFEEAGSAVALAYDILQAAGSRVTKVEFISCPSCARTRFDIQAVAGRIKARLGHLAGIRIAVMGCVVNGPGEMSDADFGCIGSASGLVDLYAGRKCVKKGVPETQAEQALVDLIKSHGRWIEPPNVSTG